MFKILLLKLSRIHNLPDVSEKYGKIQVENKNKTPEIH